MISNIKSQKIEKFKSFPRDLCLSKLGKLKSDYCKCVRIPSFTMLQFVKLWLKEYNVCINSVPWNERI